MNYFQRVLWKRNRTWQALLISLMTLPRSTLMAADWADSLQPTVSIRASAFEHGKDLKERDTVYPASVWLSVKPDPIAEVHAFVEASARMDSADRKGQMEIREGYLERSFGPLDLRIGRQVIVWGRADKLNPTDVLTSKDLRRLSSDDEDQRLGIGSAQATWNIGDSRLIGVWQYEWRRPLFPEFADIPGIRLEQKDPQHADRQYALKWDHAGGQVDWSLSSFSGYNRTPDLALGTANPDDLELCLVHQRIRTFGGDLAFNAFDMGWRGEWVHVQTEDQAADDPLQQNSSQQVVVGGDRNIVENFNMNLQLFAKWVERDDFATELDPLSQALAQRLKTNAQQRHPYQDGASLRLNSKYWQETLELEAALVWNRQDGDRLLRPKVSYAWNDHLKTILGAEIYRGPSQSFFGQLRAFSTAYAELRYGF